MQTGPIIVIICLILICLFLLIGLVKVNYKENLVQHYELEICEECREEGLCRRFFVLGKGNRLLPVDICTQCLDGMFEKYEPHAILIFLERN